MHLLRYYLRLTKTFLVRFKFLIFSGAVWGIMLFFLLSFLSNLFFSKSVERIGVVGRFQPDRIPNKILGQVSLGLTTMSSAGEVEPGIAEGWETKDGGRSWDFHLKDNLFWQDSTPVTSESIHYQFEGVKIEYPNLKTIRFILQSTFSPFPSVVSRPAFKKGLLGMGDWKVKKISFSGTFVEKLSLVNKEKEVKIYKFYPGEERAILAFKLGEVDILDNLVDASNFDKWDTLDVKPFINKNRVLTVFFNTQDSLLSAKSLRQALYYAIDKDKFGDRAIGPISPLSFSFNPQVKTYNFDQDRAKELVEESLKNLKEGAKIRLISPPFLLKEAEKVAEDWRNIGVATTVQVTFILPEEYQAYLAIYEIPADPDQYPTWHSTQAETNISKFKNARIDKLLEEGRVKLSLEDRKKIYFDFQRFLAEEAPAAFLSYPTDYRISRK